MEHPHQGQDRPKPHPEPQVRTEIIVNARPRVVQGHIVTFEEVVRLAFPDAPHDPNTVFTVTYRGAVSKPTSGELAAGGQVKAKKGTIFNVTKTTKS